MVGAAAGAATAAMLHAPLGEALVPFDGAWLGLAFATPLGIVIGWALACKTPEAELPVSADCEAPRCSKPVQT
jgi:hypothetical protein